MGAVGGPYEFGWGLTYHQESVATIRHAIDSGVDWVDPGAHSYCVKGLPAVTRPAGSGSCSGPAVSDAFEGQAVRGRHLCGRRAVPRGQDGRDTVRVDLPVAHRHQRPH
jgi:hypothetical protein